MRYVIIRDDDTNALTPIECLERLYRPFLDRDLPVNLAVIPDVATDAAAPDGKREQFLSVEPGVANGPPASAADPSSETDRARESQRTIPIGSNAPLVRYLLDNPGYQIVQHGCHHDPFEFDRNSASYISHRLEHGTSQLMEAGFPRPQTFVAPHDKLSRAALRHVAGRFRVLSTGWFELRRLPLTWWPEYLAKRIRHAPHWRVGRTILLSHPGCLLSCHRNYDAMFDEVVRNIESRRLTVLVTHWWEYFRDGHPDDRFIPLLRHVAEYLSTRSDISVIPFSDLAEGRVTLN
jgi:hypothetical protein